MSITEFLLARITEDEENAGRYVNVFPDGDMAPLFQHVLAECKAKRRIVEFHKAWPILVETPPTLENLRVDADSFAMRMSKQMAWMTEQEYRERFGDEPPTAPMLLALASTYADHPDYREEWRI